MKLEPGQAAKAAKLFGLTKMEEKLLAEVPYRGSLPPGPPTDPLIYRFYELIQVYGTTFKELIQEDRSEEHTSELQSLMRISYAVFCLKKKTREELRTTVDKLHTTKEHPSITQNTNHILLSR